MIEENVIEEKFKEKYTICKFSSFEYSLGMLWPEIQQDIISQQHEC